MWEKMLSVFLEVRPIFAFCRGKIGSLLRLRHVLAEHPMSFKVPDRLLTDGQCRMRINGVQFVQALLEANGLAVGKDYQFKGRYEAEKNAVIISLEKDERECWKRRKNLEYRCGSIEIFCWP